MDDRNDRNNKAENTTNINPTASREDSLITLVGHPRTVLGKSGARKVRRDGLVPANLLNGDTSVAISLAPKWLEKIWKTGGVFNLETAGSEGAGVVQKVKIHEVQLHPVKRIPVHLDLMAL